jgi:glycine/D-amino acid oxidase-like deaminating enzyme
LLETPPPRPALNENTTADWVVIGAGFAGLSAARRLAELHPTDRIVVLEASRIADGPSGRNSGFMIDVPHDLSSDDYGGNAENDHRQIRLNRAAIDYALAAKAQWQMTDEAIVGSGKINGAMTARGVKHNKAYAAHLDHLREPYERLDATAMHEVTGTRCYVEGLYSPGTVMLQPALYTRNLAVGIESNRVRIHESSAVVSLQKQGAAWVVNTPQGTVSTPKVILTVNGHLQSFGYYRQHLIHVFTYASMTRALTAAEVNNLGGHRHWALTPADPLGTTVRRISGVGGDRIIIRNRATFDPSLQVSDQRIQSVGRDHDNSFANRFPMLKGVNMEYRWGGRLCLSRNSVSVFEEVDANLFVACCQNGLGTAKGTISGKLIAEYASGISSALLDDQLADTGPLKLPPAPIAKAGASLRLKWGEFRAGKEL